MLPLIFGCAEATSRLHSATPITSSSIAFTAPLHSRLHSNRSFRSPIPVTASSPSTRPARCPRSCGWRLRACSVGRKTGCGYACLLGGGFGAKTYIKLEALVAALALLVHRPVKISLTMEEQFYTLTKHASTFRIKSGVKDGRITARHCEVWWNGGA